MSQIIFNPMFDTQQGTNVGDILWTRGAILSQQLSLVLNEASTIKILGLILTVKIGTCKYINYC